MKINPYSLPDLIRRLPEQKLELWVCTYEQRSVAQKVLRKLPPTCVVATMRGSFSGTLFNGNVELIDKVKQKVIKLYSNTGQALNIYDNYEECKKEFNTMIFERLEQTKVEKERLIESMNKREKDLESLFIDTDYLMEKMSHNK